MPITLDDLRRYAVARNFPKPATLNRTLQQMGFVSLISKPFTNEELSLAVHRSVEDSKQKA